jgi:hypothetical protein
MNEPKFIVGAIVRSGFFYKYFPDGHEGQNRFMVEDTIVRPKKGRVYRVKMIETPNTVCEFREDEIETAP